VHWGANGGAGLLCRYAPPGGEPRYLLTQRSRSVDEGGTWGIPGGTIRDGETPEAAGRREVMEEIDVLPDYRLLREEVQDCDGGWRFHIFVLEVADQFEAYTGRETDATGWFTPEEVRSLLLHSGIRRWLDGAADDAA
jgi:8-oxo-dGTP diphosphatase